MLWARTERGPKPCSAFAHCEHGAVMLSLGDLFSLSAEGVVRSPDFWKTRWSEVCKVPSRRSHRFLHCGEGSTSEALASTLHIVGAQ